MSTIIVPIDFSVSADRAIRRAIIQAKSIGASLILVHVEVDPDRNAVPSEMSTARRAELADLARSIRDHDGVTCESEVRTGTVADQVVQVAEERSATFVIVGPHERGLRDLVANPVVETISQRSRIPIIVANSLPVGAYRHILLGTRLDEPSAEMARWLAANPLGGSPDLSMLFVHDLHGALPLADHANLPLGTSHPDEELRLAQKALRDFLTENDLTDRVYPKARLLRGPVSLAFDDYASELDCDLVAIAGSQKTFIERVVTGSVGKDVLREVARDILVYPPTEALSE